jgi:hypothetical protein
MNIGHSSRLAYDDATYVDRLRESTDPLLYRVNRTHMYNCDNCLSVLGPRGGGMNPSVSRVNKGGLAPAQDLADLESIMTNRNVKLSKAKTGHVNPIDVTKYKLYHNRICNDTLNPENTRLSYPAMMYRETSINRFYDLPQNPQEPIFWDFAVDTKLEAKDNFNPLVPTLWDDRVQPTEQAGVIRTYSISCEERRK